MIWPEAAVPDYADNLPADVMDQLQRHPAAILFGVVERMPVGDGGEWVYFNSVFLVDGDRTTVYRKRHLVPFGEFLPLRQWLLWLLDYLQIPMSNFSSWQEKPDRMHVGQVNLGPGICYEDAFQRDVLRMLPDSHVLVNVSEDAWFGDSLAPHQRIQMAQIRSLESGRPMLRAANTGITAVLDADGRIGQRTEQFTFQVLRTQVQPTTGVTPFVAYGNLLLGSFMLLLHGALLVWGLRSQKE